MTSRMVTDDGNVSHDSYRCSRTRTPKRLTRDRGAAPQRPTPKRVAALEAREQSPYAAPATLRSVNSQNTPKTLVSRFERGARNGKEEGPATAVARMSRVGRV
jgi:hypothetical protein